MLTNSDALVSCFECAPNSVAMPSEAYVVKSSLTTCINTTILLGRRKKLSPQSNLCTNFVVFPLLLFVELSRRRNVRENSLCRLPGGFIIVNHARLPGLKQNQNSHILPVEG